MSNEGRFIAISTSGFATIGEPTGSSLRMTEQFAVPPLISGPYEGSQLTSLPSERPLYARNLPAKSTPWPPNPAISI